MITIRFKNVHGTYQKAVFSVNFMVVCALELSSEAIGCGPSLEKEYKTEKLLFTVKIVLLYLFYCSCIYSLYYDAFYIIIK